MLVGRELVAVQTTCESLGADCNHFILGIPERLKPVDDWVLEGDVPRGSNPKVVSLVFTPFPLPKGEGS
jgi:hypothetical protein